MDGVDRTVGEGQPVQKSPPLAAAFQKQPVLLGG